MSADLIEQAGVLGSGVRVCDYHEFVEDKVVMMMHRSFALDADAEVERREARRTSGAGDRPH